MSNTKRVASLSLVAQRAAKANNARILGMTAMNHLSMRHLSTEEKVESNSTESAHELVQQAAQSTSPDALVNAASQIGDFKALGLCNFTPVGGLEAMFEYIHLYSGLPWWATIAAATLVVRFALLPMMVKIQRNNARLMNINPDVTRIMENLKAAQAQGDALATGKYTQEIQTLFKKNECHPMKSLGLPLIQMPIMISFFMAIRGMAEVPVPGLQDQGLFWFSDLAAKDPYYVLPALSAAGAMAVLEAGTEAGAANPQSKGMKNVFRGLTVLVIPFTAWMPSGVFVYWITSNLFSIGQILALKNPSIRKALNIPQLIKRPEELQKNTKGFMENFKDQQKHYEKLEKDRALRERQQATAAARRAAKRRF
ncbi:60Kd inner membrane protein-domain-containing protein [Gilbertella persicaria]|uniref:60Kd inner membrane protein-domain-containing protein n=1 Tax=Gilbertella persicaria TaxID=101096 RepID=UPI0022208B1B|nr:60Kd inner membrane protein-domain-containing protein [Gilbertella persicaria]KAI8059936.1 60Kd inner membrane protein-domain-containing protein [Gilbertella persicaria]